MLLRIFLVFELSSRDTIINWWDTLLEDVEMSVNDSVDMKIDVSLDERLKNQKKIEENVHIVDVFS